MHLTRQEKIDTLQRAKKEMEEISDKEFAYRILAKESTLRILAEAGEAVGYRPAFRVLVKNEDPETALREEEP